MHAPATLIHPERFKFEVPNSKWSEKVAADTVENAEPLGEKEYLKKKVVKCFKVNRRDRKFIFFAHAIP